MTRSVAILLTCLALGACEQPTSPLSRNPPPTLAPHTDLIANQWIVVLNEYAVSPKIMADELRRGYGVTVKHVYEHALSGLAIVADKSVIDLLNHDPRVKYIEQDRIFHLDGTQANPTWGLDRVDQHTLPLDHSYTYTNTGAGSHIYIIDSGVRSTHQDLTGRIGAGYNACSAGGSLEDLSSNGHGTGVATIAAGTLVGVAKAATIHPVKVDCGTLASSDVVEGVNWVTANRIMPAVANMSFGITVGMVSVNTAVTNSIASGITYVAAAGNSNTSACNQSPAQVDAVITVAASTITDARRSNSNYGSCVDVFAPGDTVLAGHNTGDAAFAPFSETSAAAPYVTGWVAQYLQAYPSATPAEVVSALRTNATPGVITNPGSGSPNLLLFIGLTRGVTASISGIATWSGGNPYFGTPVTWNALAGGGNGTFAYQWVWQPCGQIAAILGTASSQTIGLLWGSPDFWLKVTVTSNGVSTSAWQFVDNTHWNQGLIQCIRP